MQEQACQSEKRARLTRWRHSKVGEQDTAIGDPHTKKVRCIAHFKMNRAFKLVQNKNIRIYLIFLEIRIIGLHFAADSIGLSSFRFFDWLRNTFLFLQE